MFGYPSYAYYPDTTYSTPRTVRQARPASLYDYASDPYGAYAQQPRTAPRYAPSASYYPVARDRYLDAVEEARVAREEYQAALAEERRRRALEQEVLRRQSRAGNPLYSAYPPPGLYTNDGVEEQESGYGDEHDYYARAREQLNARKRTLTLAEQRRQQQEELEQQRIQAQKKQERIRAFEEALLSRQRAEEEAKQRREPTAAAQRSSSPPRELSPTLRQKLEARLHGEQDPEVRLAILNMLGQPAAPQPASTPAASTAQRELSPRQQSPAPTAAPAQSATLSSPTTTNAATSTPRKDRSPSRPPANLTPLQKIAHIRNSFNDLTSSFILPTTLDFTPAPATKAQTTSSSIHPNLTFSHINAPLHAHTHALNALLDQLDAVESDGDVEVRTGRKEMVRTVERELGVLEGKVRAMWKKESGVVEEREEEEKEQATQEEMEVDAHLSEEDSQVSPPSATSSESTQAVDSISTPIPSTTEEDVDTDMVHVESHEAAPLPSDTSPAPSSIPAQSTPSPLFDSEMEEEEDAEMVPVEEASETFTPHSTDNAPLELVDSEVDPVHKDDWIDLDDSNTRSDAILADSDSDSDEVERAIATPLPPDSLELDDELHVLEA